MSSVNLSFTSSKGIKVIEDSLYSQAVEAIKELREKCHNNIPMLISIVSSGLREVCCDWSSPPTLRDSSLQHSEQGKILSEVALGVVPHKKLAEKTILRSSRISAGMYYRALPPRGPAGRKTTSMFKKLLNSIQEECFPTADYDFNQIINGNGYELMHLLGETKGSFENTGVSYTTNHIDWLSCTPDAILKTFSNWYPIEVVKKMSEHEKQIKEQKKQRREEKEAAVAAKSAERMARIIPEAKADKKGLAESRHEKQKKHLEDLRQRTQSANSGQSLDKRKKKKNDRDEDFEPKPTKKKIIQQPQRFQVLAEGDTPRNFGGKIVSNSSFTKELDPPKQKIELRFEDFEVHPEKVWQVKVAMVLFSSPKGLLIQLEGNIARAKVIHLLPSEIQQICSRQYSDIILESLERLASGLSTPEEEDKMFQEAVKKIESHMIL